MKLFHRVTGRGLIAFCHDIVMAGLSIVIAIYLRVGQTFYGASDELMREGALAMIAIAAVVFWMSGLYRGVWRYASIDDLMAITRAVTIVILVFVGVMFFWTRMDDLPRLVPIINWFVLMALLGAPRFLYRFWKDRRISLRKAQERESIPVVLIGAGDGADTFLRALKQSGAAPYEVVGILAEQQENIGRTIRNVTVSGSVDTLEDLVQQLRRQAIHPQRVVLTKDAIDGATVRELVDRTAKLGMTVARMPKVTDLNDAGSAPISIKPIAIEDLLGRPQTPLDRDAMRGFISGRRVAITGAGGSIGSELVRQVAAFGPAELALIENNEFALYRIDREIAADFPLLRRHALIADVRDRSRTFKLFDEFQPEIVFHAAALKHVPIVEDNPNEGIQTNIAGTVNVADACQHVGALAMVQISTDKAVNPTSVMGATKRAAEMYCQAMDRASDGCRYVTVRFGNVLGSTGSVVPLFQQQLEQGGPLTVTDPEMKRYFMTIREAVELVLEASAIGSGPEKTAGRIFVLDMGKPVKIIDLARQMIRLSGKEPGTDIEITITGIRPGEKLFEEVLHDKETTVQTAHAGLFLATPRSISLDELQQHFDTLFGAVADGDQKRAVQLLHDLIPEYSLAQQAQAS